MICTTDTHYSIFCLDPYADERNTRLLNAGKVHPHPIEIALVGEPWTYLSCPHLDQFDDDRDTDHVVAHNDSIVLAIDGRYRFDAVTSTRGAIGIFVHADSELNVSREIHEPNYKPTRQRTKLHAALAGLELAASVRSRNDLAGQPDGPFRRLRHVVLKADAPDLFHGMRDWERWEGLEGGWVLSTTP